MCNNRLKGCIAKSKLVISPLRLKISGRFLHEGNLGMHTQAPANIEGDHALQPQGYLGPVRLARIVRRSLVQTAHFKRGLRTGKVKAIVRAKRLRCSIFTGGRRLVCAHNRRFGHR